MHFSRVVEDRARTCFSFFRILLQQVCASVFVFFCSGHSKGQALSNVFSFFLSFILIFNKLIVCNLHSFISMLLVILQELNRARDQPVNSFFSLLSSLLTSSMSINIAYKKQQSSIYFRNPTPMMSIVKLRGNFSI